MTCAEKYDDKAKKMAANLKRCESALLTLLIEMKEKRIFGVLESSGIYHYCTEKLKLSESQAQYYKKVAEKSRTVPELKDAVEKGTISLSQARRIEPVITPANHEEWIGKAATLKQKALERAVSDVNPNAHITERIRPVAKGRSEMRAGISTELEAKIERVKDVLAQKLKRHVTLEEAIEAMAECFLDKNDKVRKAERIVSSRKAPALAHQVNARDQGQCTDVDAHGNRCTERRWLDLHHVIHRAKGGPDTLPNLTTLCARHHRRTHQCPLPPPAGGRAPAPRAGTGMQP
jgi:hypothetical protein